MKSVLLVCGAVLISASPVFADSIPYSALAQDSPGVAFAVNAPSAAKFVPAAALSPLSLIDAAELNSTPNPWDLASYKPFYAFSFDGATHPGSLDDLALLASSGAITGSTLLADDQGDKHFIILDPARHHDNDVHHHATALPEPGTLALALLGVFAIGLLAFTRLFSRVLGGRAGNLPTAP